jgi:prepilin-type N-terminal cleavage/methylation domain-containing protein
MLRSSGQKGFTLIEVITASLIMVFLVAALLNYHGSSGAAKNQVYYLKAVQVARAELDKLRALYEVDSGCSEFQHTGPVPADFLYRFTGVGEKLEFSGPDPSKPTYHVYYTPHGTNETFLRPLGDSPPYAPLVKSGVSYYQKYYCEAYNKAGFEDTDQKDRRTLTYFTYDTAPGYPPHADADHGQVNASLVVIDDMGSPYDCEDDLLGSIGWWIEDVAVSGVTVCKKVAFFLAFRYPGEGTGVNPELVCLKTTLVKP